MRAPLLLLVLLVGCGGPRPRPGGGDPEPLVACWRDALGGADRLAAVRALEREARVEADGLTGTLHRWSRADGALHEDSTLGPSSDVTVVAGGRAWYRAGMGAPLEVTHSELARLRTDAYLASFAPLVPGRMAGRVRMGPRPHTLIVAPDGGREETVALDPRSCLPVQQEHDSDEVHVTTTWPRWTTLDGVRLPAEVAIKTSHGDEIRIAYTATRINPAIDPALFQPPGVDPRARAAADRAGRAARRADPEPRLRAGEDLTGSPERRSIAACSRMSHRPETVSDTVSVTVPETGFEDSVVSMTDRG